MLENTQLLEASKGYTRVFIFASTESLEDYQSQFKIEIEHFLKKWRNEKNPLVKGNWSLFDKHFIMVFADESNHALSGCSKDFLHHLVFDFAKKNNLEIPSPYLFIKKDTSTVQVLSRSDFSEAKERGDINPKTLVYDTILTQTTQLNQFIRPCQDSWHHQL